MQNNKLIVLVVFTIVMLFPTLLRGQGSSLNAFSPYTFYGIGDLSVQGAGFTRSMGGAGVGFRNAMKVNYLNPASFSIMRQKTFLFNVEIEGNNIYAKSPTTKTSHNSFNVRDIALAFPLTRAFGLGISVTPLSSVGYKVQMYDTDPTFLANNMNVLYSYVGEGGITQIKAGLGLQLIKRLSAGVDFIYYHGRISRYFDTDITSILTNEKFVSALGTDQETVSRFGTNVGLQYDLLLTEKRIITLGVTYRPRTNLYPNTNRSIYTTSINGTKVMDTTWHKNFYLPNMYTAGLCYQSMKWSMALDYSFQQWTGLNSPDLLNGVEFKNSQSVMFGIQYIPNPIDVRSILNRWSYRIGFRYSDYYMKINGRNISDKAITLGVGIPLKVQGLSSVNVGLEFGQRGRSGEGLFGTRKYQMVRENYFKVSIGLSLFGEDDWFKRYKYQ